MVGKLGIIVRATVAAVALLLLTAAGSRAARPITLTTAGIYPQLAVDRSGSANIVWTTLTGGTNTITYCEIPDHGTHCAISHTFATGNPLLGSAPRVILGPANGEVIVLGDTDGYAGAFGGEGIAVWVSMDGGTTFSAGVEGGGYVHAPGETYPSFALGSKPAFGPGATGISMLDDAGYFEDIPIDAGSAVGPEATPGNTEDTALFADRCGGYGATAVAMVNATTPIAACQAGTPGAPTALEYRIATGQGDIDNAATGSWGAVGTFPIGGGSGDYDNVVGGPRGVFANYESSGSDLDVRHLSGARFGPATTIARRARPYDFSQDLNGNLYVADFHNIDVGDPLDVLTSADGKTWTQVPISTPGLTLPGPGAEVGGCTAASARESGNGWVVWAQGGGTPNGKLVAESFGHSRCGVGRGAAACPAGWLKTTRGKAVCAIPAPKRRKRR